MEIQKKKSFALGVVGAVIGGLLGAASIILLAQAGIISAISGFVLAFCTLKGFELLGGKLDKKSIIVCVVIMLVVPYLAHHTSYAIIFVQNWEDLQFGDAFAHLYNLIDTVDTINENTELISAFIKDLLFIYAFTALGGFTIVKQAFAKKNEVIEEAPEGEVIEELPTEETVEEAPVQE
ncbi:MAG: hypothetical protein E7447_01565 [Ruminococcaceae bacterium]|nr:hypothetical protein [Oscillospiraceae bacterium]